MYQGLVPIPGKLIEHIHGLLIVEQILQKHEMKRSEGIPPIHASFA
jgi:hypothetical protein